MVKRRTKRRRRKNVGKGTVFGKCTLGEDSQARREDAERRRAAAIALRDKYINEDLHRLKETSERHVKEGIAKEWGQKRSDEKSLNDLLFRYSKLPESAKLNSGKGLIRKTKRHKKTKGKTKRK